MLIFQIEAQERNTMKKQFKRLLFLAVVLSFSSLAYAGPLTNTINFEQYGSFTEITNQYASQGVTFVNAMELVAPDLDTLDYPPHSGSGVITNDSGDFDYLADPITVTFAPGATDITGWYSDPNGMTVTAYDQSNDVLATFLGGATNEANAEFSITSDVTGISYIVISDDLGSTDYVTVDDLSYTLTPEPGSFVLLGTGLLGIAGVLRRKLAR
jgi:hypothetical protein